MSSHAQVRVRPRPLWLLQLGPSVTRNLVRIAALMGLLASTRFAVDPPRPSMVRPPVAQQADLAGQGYATLFVRRYLTWDSSAPDEHRQGLQGFTGPDADPDFGLRPPPAGHQSVLWAQVVQSRTESGSERVYTIAAQTDTAGLVYLTVPVVREASGSLALGGFPAFVGAPASVPATDPVSALHDVEDLALTAVVERALGNYLAGASSELASDLSAAARVALPEQPLTLQRLQELKWSPDRGSVIAVAQAARADGAVFTVAYEMDVLRVAGRWEISAIQMDPYA